MNILKDVQSQVTNGKLTSLRDKGEYIQCTCPFHAEGHEHRPSCSVYTGTNMTKGLFHCFTCGEKGDFTKFIASCFGTSYEKAKTFLISNYGKYTDHPSIELPDFTIPQKKVTEFLSEDSITGFSNYHPYMTQRKLSDQIISKFEVKYDPATNCLVFPVRDKFGRLVYLTRRSVDSKRFIIDTGVKKEVYLLYNVMKTNAKKVYICESQINALVCESYGQTAVATFGCGCPDYQINDLNNTGVMNYVIAFDPDQAGLKGIIRLCDNLKNKFVSVMVLPKGKDVGDLTQEEFNNCPIIDKDLFLKEIPDYYAE